MEKLCSNVQQFAVLPTRAKDLLVKELNKRLDLDIDRIIESPKLRLQLSPAELDQRLLELYKSVAEGPTGDVLRIIGGGQEVALQDFYIKSRATRKAAKDPQALEKLRFGPFQTRGDDTDDARRTASQWVNLVLRRNLPKNEVSFDHNPQGRKDDSKMFMSLKSNGSPFGNAPKMLSYKSHLGSTSFIPPHSRSAASSLCLLI
jgi:hypothetical protein